YLFCDDPAVLGADFFVMERRRGEVVRDAIPPALREHRDAGRRLAFALVEAMAELHALEPAACGLEDLGRPDGFIDRQLDGWAKRWALARPEDGPAEMERIHERLARARPALGRTSIVHNDLKLDNCQFAPDRPDRVASIFDWDMATLGDSLVDLGTLLNYWPDPMDTDATRRGARPGLAHMGLPTRAEITERYAALTGADPGAARWWEAFALWKTVVVVVQLHRRWARGESTDPRMAHIADRAPSLVAAVQVVLDNAGL
ncbi:MAG: phosphotransferase family protein, partial [Candidatus Rokuibacteriota bacterium]